MLDLAAQSHASHLTPDSCAVHVVHIFYEYHMKENHIPWLTSSFLAIVLNNQIILEMGDIYLIFLFCSKELLCLRHGSY